MIDRGVPALVRAIGRWSLLAAIINAVIGSGIFGLPSSVAALAGVWSPALVLMAGAAMFVVVLCFAEVGSRFDEAGGPYLYARHAFGPAVGFQVGWLLFVGRLLSASMPRARFKAPSISVLPPAYRPSTKPSAAARVSSLNFCSSGRNVVISLS